ncbi:hypothetical protein FSP39_025219 [Pinctada imbricata]|uniref:thiopurine S-methyltransferase n=1 Tax=Pinctada imbricata TaxID=66713 RepID=A0AA88XUQ6_PINIB|nr:hypothetical protein FSP39_025219 [Pinctada imbricata]
MTVKDWTYRWEKDQTQFHMSKIHPMLAKHIDALTEGKKRLRFFVPLCGKTVDMRWLAEQGHEVIGLEAVEKGCREFFVEQKIPYSVKDLQNCKGKIFKATDDKKIQLYCCDFFDLERLSLGTFDCIWDRGSFVAVAVKERKRYLCILYTVFFIVH